MELSDSPSVAELLTEQFYDWEIRGRGWLVWDSPVQLEPPFRRFQGHVLPKNIFCDDGRESSFLSSIADCVLGFLRPPDLVETKPDQQDFPEFRDPPEELTEIQFSLPRDLQPSPEVFEQCIFSLVYCRSPIAFELVGTKENLVVQVACGIADSATVLAQLKSHFPDAVLTSVRGFLSEKVWPTSSESWKIHEFGLGHEFMLPLRSRKELAVDPMVTLCGALEQLQHGEVAIVQIIFEPARNEWAESAWTALTTTDGKPFFEGDREMVAISKRKLTSSLFAVVIRVGVLAAHLERHQEIIRAIAGALRPFDLPGGNRLILLENENYDDDDHQFDLLNRCSRRSGMLLSSDELIAIAHLPTAAVRSRKLTREIKLTKKAPDALTKTGVLLGVNEHEGEEVLVRLPDTSRVEHMHVLGTQGTGKSTLLLNLISQDISAGRGIAVLDPHGDLIDDILGSIPPERHQDVIIIDPADELYPIGFNVLSAKTTIEKNLLASDLVAVFRRLSTSWGDQMSSVLGNAVLAFVENSRIGTLPELRRFFVEPSFRNEVLSTVTDPDIAYYWEKEFPLLKSNSLGPLLTRLDMFLRPKSIRYMVGQRENKIDFDAIMNEGKILLARLSQGIIGEENGFLLGTLLVSKFHQVAISRQTIGSQDRRPFFLYIDEFHHFVSPSMASILTGVRKYRLGLILAHQNLSQLRDPDVANTVLSSPYARICFRVGDQDAKRVAESLSFFEASDLLNLGKGEAICRIQKNDWDFNLETSVPPRPTDEEAKSRREALQSLTRRHYGIPREKVEEELAKSRVTPDRERNNLFLKRTTQSNEPQHAEDQKVANTPNATAKEKKSVLQKSNEAANLGAGDPEEEAVYRNAEEIKTRIIQHSGKLGFSYEEEKRLPNERRIDLVLYRHQIVIACEISSTTSAEHEIKNIEKCVRHGHVQIFHICNNRTRRAKIAQLVSSSFSAAESRRVECVSVGTFLKFLTRIPTEQPSQPPVVAPKSTLTEEALTPDLQKALEQDMLSRLRARLNRKNQ